MDESIKKHNIFERKLKHDIVKKNTLRRQLTGDIRKVAHWTELLETVNNRRKRKRYVQDIERYVPRISKNKKIVKKLIDELEIRINDELKYSEKEVLELKKKYKKEYDELIEARKLVLKAKKGNLSEKEIETLAGISVEEMMREQDEAAKSSGKESGEKVIVVPKEELLAKAQKKLRKEAKGVAMVNEELDSEAKDKILFQNELRRMVFEKEILA